MGNSCACLIKGDENANVTGKLAANHKRMSSKVKEKACNYFRLSL